MSDDFRVKPLSDEEVRAIARKARACLNVTDGPHVDILAYLNQPFIWTVRGKRQLNLQIRPDAEMGADDGSTIFAKDVVTIALKKSVADEATMGVGRARNTCAHEFGHATLAHMSEYHGVGLSRRTIGNVTPKWIPAFQSAEHQAKVFAPAFLIDDAIAETLSTAEEIAVEFGISIQSANIYFTHLAERRARSETSKKFRQFADEFRASTRPPSRAIKYLDDSCNQCSKQTLFPVGTKLMCDTCKNVSDRFQDGDV